MKQRVGLITTLNTNLGDDLIREGICRVIEAVFPGSELEYILVNKHHPFTVYPQGHPLRRIGLWLQSLPRGKNRLYNLASRIFHRFGSHLFENCDFIVQCGTPVAWPQCSRSEWAIPLWEHIISRIQQKGKKVLNLGAGSCYPWERQPQQINNSKDAHFLRKILSYCQATTVRDRLAQKLFSQLGYSCPLLPCPAFLTGRFFSPPSGRGDTLVINYMEKGGHYDWGQGIDPQSWREALLKVLERIRKAHPVIFLCHSKKEYSLAFSLDPSIPRVFPQNPQEYFSVITQALAGIGNRLHSVIALASLGIPALGIGTDTRLLMLEAIGLPYLYVKEAQEDRVEEILRYLLNHREEEKERLLSLQNQSWGQYVTTVEEALTSS